PRLSEAAEASVGHADRPRPPAAAAAEARDDGEDERGHRRPPGDMTAARKVLLTTPRFLTFEPFVREFLRDRNCEVVEHDSHDMQMKEDTLVRLISEAEGLVTA